jgi:cation diffusion facilitator CzcD-associated flavoprotein CzcO
MAKNKVVPTRTVNTVIVGSGIHGTAVAMALREQRFHDFILLDPLMPMANWRRLTSQQGLQTLRSGPDAHIHPNPSAFADFLKKEGDRTEGPVSLSSFNRFTWNAMGEYEIPPHHVPGRATHLEYERSTRGWALTAWTMDGKQRIHAKHVVVAIGPGVPNINRNAGPSSSNVLHSDAFDIGKLVSESGNWGRRAEIAIIGGGLTAATLAVNILSKTNKVSAPLVMCVKGPLTVSQLEVDPSWVTQRSMLEQFRRLTGQARVDMIGAARTGRSITPDVYVDLMSYIAGGYVQVVQTDTTESMWSTVDDGRIKLAAVSNRLFDRVYLATGYTTDVSRVGFLKEVLSSQSSAQVVGGLPVINSAQNATWAPAPLLFTGRLGEYHAGPLGRNIPGAMSGANVIAAAITGNTPRDNGHRAFC